MTKMAKPRGLILVPVALSEREGDTRLLVTTEDGEPESPEPGITPETDTHSGSDFHEPTNTPKSGSSTVLQLTVFRPRVRIGDQVDAER